MDPKKNALTILRTNLKAIRKASKKSAAEAKKAAATAKKHLEHEGQLMGPQGREGI